MSDMGTILDGIVNVFTVIVILTVVGGGFLLVILAAKSMAEARVIRVGSIALILLILVLTGIGLSDYPAYLMESTIKGLNKASALSPQLRSASRDFAVSVLGDSAFNSAPPDSGLMIDGVPVTPLPDNQAGGGIVNTDEFPTAAPAPDDLFTATPEPTVNLTPTATVDVVLLATQNAVQVTRYPTETPTNTPVPTIDAKSWNPMTPAPTPQPGG